MKVALVFLTLIVVLPIQARANSYTFGFDFKNDPLVNRWSDEWKYMPRDTTPLYWSLGFLDQGFDPQKETVISAVLYAVLADDQAVIHPTSDESYQDNPITDGQEWVKVFVEGSFFYTPELGFPATYTFFPSVDLFQDGTVNIGFATTDRFSDYVLDRFWVDVETQLNPVPEPSTMVLFGVGTLVIASWLIRSKKISVT